MHANYVERWLKREDLRDIKRIVKIKDNFYVANFMLILKNYID
jgi:uncharacterized protein YfkK (UPF0435 family)